MGQIVKSRFYESVFHCRFNASNRVAKKLGSEICSVEVSTFLLIGNVGANFCLFYGHTFTKNVSMVLKFTEIMGTIERMIPKREKSKFPNRAKF